MAVAEDQNSNNTSDLCMIDEVYEFRAPKFYDFIAGETEEEIKKSELWFETACSYAPSRMISSLILKFIQILTRICGVS